MALFRKKDTPDTATEVRGGAASASGGNGAGPGGKAGAGGDNAAPGPTSRDARKARGFFDYAHRVADFDYAIECYINGLVNDPGNYHEHLALRETALRRKLAKGKPAALSEKIGSGGRTAVDRMLNTEKLWSKDPLNLRLTITMMQQVIEADREEPELGLAKFAEWIGERLIKFEVSKAPEIKDWTQIADLFAALKRYDLALYAMNQAKMMDRFSPELDNKIKEFETERTIQNAGYDKAGQQGTGKNFIAGLKNAEEQKKLYDDQVLSKTGSQVDAQIDRRREELLKGPDDPDRMAALADALRLRDTDESDDQAIALLRKAFEKSGVYRHRQQMGDVQIKQLTRQARLLKEKVDAHPEDAELREEYETFLRVKLQYELDEHTARAKQYPTAMEHRFQRGVRLLQLGQHDEAISEFQAAKIAPKLRSASHLYLGKAYQAQGWFDEAVDTLRKGIEIHAQADDNTGMEMRYLLMDALEASSTKNRDLEQARESARIGSQILQSNINYMDIKSRMEKIRGLVDELQKERGRG